MAYRGGKSGPGARPMEADWVLDLRDQWNVARIPFFFKQLGGVFKRRNGRNLEGRTRNRLPEKRARSIVV